MKQIWIHICSLVLPLFGLRQFDLKEFQWILFIWIVVCVDLRLSACRGNTPMSPLYQFSLVSEQFLCTEWPFGPIPTANETVSSLLRCEHRSIPISMFSDSKKIFIQSCIFVFGRFSQSGELHFIYSISRYLSQLRLYPTRRNDPTAL